MDYAAREREIEQFRRGREVNVKENGYWLSLMQDMLQEGRAPEAPLSVEEFSANLSEDRMTRLANTIFDENRRLKILLLPEN